MKNGYKNLQISMPPEFFEEMDKKPGEIIADVVLFFDDTARKLGVDLIEILDKHPTAEKFIESVRKRLKELRYLPNES